MSFEIDITKQLTTRQGARFTLQSSFSTQGGRLVLFGPSGSGKSLTLQAIAGLLTPDSGRIRVGGRTLYDSAAGINLPPRRRKIGIIFQDYALFPHMTVRQNVAFGLRRLWQRHTPAHARRVNELLALFCLARVAEAYPEDISGGQRQRVALARGLAADPDLLLLDEPFSALDRPLRLKMQKELAATLEDLTVPLVLVTHDADEMAYFADTVVVYDGGRVTAMEETCDGKLNTCRVVEALEKAYESVDPPR